MTAIGENRYGVNVRSNAKITTVTGLPGSGKTYLLQHKIIPEARRPVMIFDPNREYLPRPKEGVYVYRIQNYENAAEEFENIVEKIINGEIKVKTLILDESNVILPKLSLLPNTKLLINTLRHYDIDMFVVARRPTDINITISELARDRFVFRTSGVNDIKRLNEIVSGLGYDAASLKNRYFLRVYDDSPVYGEGTVKSRKIVKKASFTG